MLSFSDATPIYLCTTPTDMRKSFDGLCGLVETSIRAGGHRVDVTGGALFVFVNRRRDRMKVLYFDADGLAIWYKRLEAGRYELPGCHDDRHSLTINARQLRLILDGIDLSSVRQRKRYARKTPAPRDVTDDGRATLRTTAGSRPHDRGVDRDRRQAQRPGGVAVAAVVRPQV